MKLQLEDLARLPPAEIIEGLLVWPDNCMLLHMQLHICRLCTVLGTSFVLPLLHFRIIGGQHVFCAAGRPASKHEKENLDPSGWLSHLSVFFDCF